MRSWRSTSVASPAQLDGPRGDRFGTGVDLGGSDEAAAVRESGVACFTMREIDEQGIRAVMEQAIAHATDGTAGFHLSFDVDGTDPSVCPGVGTPVAGGITYREAHTVMEMAATSGKLVSLELTEINPILDNQNQTARAAVESLERGKRLLQETMAGQLEAVRAQLGRLVAHQRVRERRALRARQLAALETQHARDQLREPLLEEAVRGQVGRRPRLRSTERVLLLG